MSTANATAERPRGTKATAAERARAKQLREEGATLAQISAEIGYSISTVGAWLDRKRHRPDSLDRDVFLRWLDKQTVTDPVRGILINGRPISESQTRSRHRWRSEGCSPSYGVVDALLRDAGLHIREFEQWAEDEGLCVWAAGEPPPGYRDDDDAWWQDLEAPYAEGPDLAPIEERRRFQAEGLDDAERHGFELPDHVILSPSASRALNRRRREHERVKRRDAEAHERVLVAA